MLKLSWTKTYFQRDYRYYMVFNIQDKTRVFADNSVSSHPVITGNLGCLWVLSLEIVIQTVADILIKYVLLALLLIWSGYKEGNQKWSD